MKKNKIISKTVSGILLCSIVAYQLPLLAYTKDETIYSKLDNEGDNYKTIVSTHITNTNNDDIINDLSDLANIKNTGNNNTFNLAGNALTWNANGDDIYYEGESQKELPIKCNVTYKLDDKDIEVKDLVGKTGKVTITINYENTDSHIVSINGKNEKIYTPFVVVAGTIINNDTNKNVSITNGKVVTNGNKTLVAGIAMPGLQESLDISKKEIDIPDSVEITMDATNFSMGNIYSFVTPKIFDGTDFDNLDDLDKIFDSVNELQGSMNQIEEGATELADGANQLAAGVDELTDENSNTVISIGNTAVSSAKLSKKQQSAIATQAATEATLSNEDKSKIATQAATEATLTDTQKQAIATEAATEATLTDSQKQAIETQAATEATLTDTQKQAIGAEAATKATLSNEQITAIKNGAKLTDTQKQEIKAEAEQNVKASDVYKNLSDADKQTTGILLIQVAQSAAIKAAEEVATQAGENAVKLAQQTATTTAKNVAVATAQSIATTTAKQVAVATAQSTATTVAKQTAVATAQSTATTVAKQTAVATAQSTATTVAKQTAVATAQSTATTVAKQTAISTTVQVASTLSSNINTLATGATTLSEGIQTFNKEGIEKICDYINGDVKNISERAKALSNLAKEYDNFTMINDGNEGNVKFIMIIDEIKEDKNNSNSEIITNTGINNEQKEENTTSSK